MITDNQTNFLYLSGLLPVRFPRFYNDLVKLLLECDIKYDLLPHTNDIWVRDFMPIQVDKDEFVKFQYNPWYLKSKRWASVRTDNTAVCHAIGLKTTDSDTIIDGGNIVRCRNTVIITDRIFQENPGKPEIELLGDLKSILKVDNIVEIPSHPDDLYGHADGWVRFVNDNTVVINDLSREDRLFRETFLSALQDAGLGMITIPCNSYGNQDKDSAVGVYVNYLEMKDLVLVPKFNLADDQQVLDIFRMLFPGRVIRQVDCGDIAEQGGVLNCISWAVFRDLE